MSGNPLTLLLSPEAEGVLGAAIGDHGVRLEDLRPADTRVRPSGAVRVRYVAEVRRSDGSRSREALVAATGENIPAGATVVAGEYGGQPLEVGVWRWQQDPALPALQIAGDSTRLAELLSAHGLPIGAAPEIAVRAYRPTQRAVLEVRDGDNRWFVKVVRPAELANLRIRHDLLSARLPVPPVLAHASEGIVVLPEASGALLRDQLSSGSDTAALPAPGELEKLLDALPDDLMQLRSNRSILDRAHDSAEVLRICAASDPALSPTQAAELTGEATRVVDAALSVSQELSEPPVPVHGDFYHGQLLADGSRITGLLDVDTAGPGERADEWATLIGYLSVLGLSHAPARGYCDAVFAHAEHRIEPGALRRRTAAVVLGLATAPFRARLDDWSKHTASRLALARNWL
jgi:aminoglycoside phosphotransferase